MDELKFNELRCIFTNQELNKLFTKDKKSTRFFNCKNILFLNNFFFWIKKDSKISKSVIQRNSSNFTVESITNVSQPFIYLKPSTQWFGVSKEVKFSKNIEKIKFCKENNTWVHIYYKLYYILAYFIFYSFFSKWTFRICWIY